MLDIARRLPKLERERAQDTAYIRHLELANATLQREKRSAGEGTAVRARAEAVAEHAAEVERMRGWVEEARERLRALEGVFFLGGEDSEEAEGGVGVWA